MRSISRPSVFSGGNQCPALSFYQTEKNSLIPQAGIKPTDVTSTVRRCAATPRRPQKLFINGKETSYRYYLHTSHL